MSLFGRTLDLNGTIIGSSIVHDATLGADGVLYSAARGSSNVTAVYAFDDAKGEADFQATMPIGGNILTILPLGAEIGVILRTPGVDAFAPSTLMLSLLDPANAPFTDEVTLATARMTDPQAVATGAGFAVIYENSGLGRGDEIVQFHDAAGEALATVNIGAQFSSDILALRDGSVVVMGNDGSGEFLRTFTASGTETGARQSIEGLGGAAALRNGGFAIAHPGQPGSGTIEIQKFGANGAPSGKALVIETDTPGTPAFADGDIALTEMPDGLLALAYETRAQGSAFETDTDIHLMILTAQGEIVDGPLELGASDTSDLRDPDFTPLTKGEVLLHYADSTSFPTQIVGQVLEGPDREVDGNDRNNTLRSGSKDDLVQADGGNDTVKSRGGDDTILGGAGDDTAKGGGGADRLDGGDGADRLTGQGGNDMLVGGLGKDLLVGSNGSDTLWGGEGGDKLSGGKGSDILWADAGDDTMTGGGGDDTFLFAASDTTEAGASDFGTDRVTDFEAGVDGFLFLGFAESQVSVARAGANARITVDGGGEIVVEDATVAEVEAAFDFLG